MSKSLYDVGSREQDDEIKQAGAAIQIERVLLDVYLSIVTKSHRYRELWVVGLHQGDVSMMSWGIVVVGGNLGM